MKSFKIVPLIVLFSLLVSMLYAVDNQKNNSSSSASEVVVKNITKSDFLKLVMNYEKNTKEWKFEGTKPCIIDFYADWCGPCRITSPILEELAAEYKGKIDIYKVNVDKERELAQVFGISGIPAFLYCPLNGKPSMTSGIAKDKEQTKKMFIDNIESILLKSK
ncbi:MAG TPA: thioredoxin domain-containing protein [Prolixibacteraceae bacterium]|nr:redoxin domain-containing protein [Bacteroidales bacterium]HNZ72296.1 thioredoxin domain-containing protein [Prolixibacteraceae bacterium]HQN93163.1 thioredoxin domain-containing protein [Prolixibacteraceae bacterium]